MAIRKRIGASGVSYQVYFNHPFTGQRVTKTFQDGKEAKAYDVKVKYRLDHDKDSFKPEKEEVKKNPLENITVQTLSVEQATFLYLKEKEFSEPHNIRFLSSMTRILERIGHIQLQDLQAIHLRNLQSILLKDKSLRHKEKKELRGKFTEMPTVSPAYVHGQLSKLRTVLRWAQERGFIQEVPPMKLPQPNYNRIIPPTPEEIERILAVASKHVQRVVILGAALGVRVGPSELLALEWKNIDLVAGVVRINTSHKNPNAPWREIPIRDDLLPIFAQWQKEDRREGIRHVVHYRNQPVNSIQTAWAATLKRAGIERRVRPYDLRHTFATQLIAAGTDVGTVAELMGHSSPAMIFKHYQHVLTKQKKRAVENLPVFSSCAKSMCQMGKEDKTEVAIQAHMCQAHVPNEKRLTEFSVSR